MNQEMYRQVILDHYKYPHNKVCIEPVGYEKREALNPSCGDHVTVYLLIENDIIKDLKFTGTGCSICCSSASVMTLELKNLTIEKAISKIDKFYEIIKNGTDKYNGEFEDGQVFSGLASFPARFKCGFLSWDTTKKIIKKETNE